MKTKILTTSLIIIMLFIGVSSAATVTINSDKTISIDGKKTFPVMTNGIWNIDSQLNGGILTLKPSAAIATTLDRHIASGFDGDMAKFYNSEWFNPLLIDLYESKKFGWVNTIGNWGVNEKIKASANFLGYNQIDEPADSLESSVSNYYTNVKRNDPEHPIFLNHWTNGKKWSPYCDILTWDTWGIIDDANIGWARDKTIYNLEFQSNAAFLQNNTIASFNKPVWAYVSANSKPFFAWANHVVPTYKEEKANVWLLITMGVGGIVFAPVYQMENPLDGYINDPIMYADTLKIGSEVKSLNDILILPTVDYRWMYHEGTRVSFSDKLTATYRTGTGTNFNYMLKQNGNTWYLIVLNKDTRPISNVEITISGLAGAITTKTIGMETTGTGRAGRMLNVNNGKFTDSFDGLAVHIYQLNSGTVVPIPTSTIKPTPTATVPQPGTDPFSDLMSYILSLLSSLFRA